jgi:hypothetical protein
MLPKARSVPFTDRAATTDAVALIEPVVPWACAEPAGSNERESKPKRTTHGNNSWSRWWTIAPGIGRPPASGGAGRQRPCQSRVGRGARDSGPAANQELAAVAEPAMSQCVSDQDGGSGAEGISCRE